MLRLDVRSDAFPDDPDRNYAIPPDNPFVGHAGADEIWALGLRNPWRDGFDRGLGDLYIADVGENRWEEINIGQAGANYGWRMREGPNVFSERHRQRRWDSHQPDPFLRTQLWRCGNRGLRLPRPERGAARTVLLRRFRQWSHLYPADRSAMTGSATERTLEIVFDAGSIDIPVSFGEDARGNLYVVDYDGGIFKLTPKVVSADQADHLQGFGGADMMFGGSGNDILDGGAEDDTLYGGDGFDTAVIHDLLGNALLEMAASGAGVVSSSNGTDALYDVERVQFDDGILALDLDGNAGQAYRLYRAAFDREADQGGLGYWIAELDTGQSDLSLVALSFIRSAEFKATYGDPGSVSDTQFVTLLYANVLDRAPDQAGLQHWLNDLGNGYPREHLLIFFSESIENKANVAEAVEHGIAFIPWTV